jgi:arylamine N-acetyltransferase
MSTAPIQPASASFSLDPLLSRLGLAAPDRPDLAWLTQAYRTWCSTVPFTNLGKLSALRSGQPLPSLEASAIVQQFLDDGSCGTCFAHAVAFRALLHGMGYEARNYAGYTSGDDGVRGEHATTIVSIDEQLWLVDTALPHGSPLQLHRDRTSQIGDVMTPMTATPRGELWQLDFVIVHNNSRRQATLIEELRDTAHTEAAFLRTLDDEKSPFNLVPIARLEVDGGSLTLAGRKLFSVHAAKAVAVEPAGPETLRRFGIRTEPYASLWEDAQPQVQGVTAKQ